MKLVNEKEKKMMLLGTFVFVTHFIAHNDGRSVEKLMLLRNSTCKGF